MVEVKAAGRGPAQGGRNKTAYGDVHKVERLHADAQEVQKDTRSRSGAADRQELHRLPEDLPTSSWSAASERRIAHPAGQGRIVGLANLPGPVPRLRAPKIRRAKVAGTEAGTPSAGGSYDRSTKGTAPSGRAGEPRARCGA